MYMLIYMYKSAFIYNYGITICPNIGFLSMCVIGCYKYSVLLLVDYKQHKHNEEKWHKREGVLFLTLKDHNNTTGSFWVCHLFYTLIVIYVCKYICKRVHLYIQVGPA